MTVIIVARVTPSLRGLLARWMLEVHAGVFVGTVSARVREELWRLVQGRKRVGACTLLYRSPNEQGFTLTTAGDTRREPVSYDGLVLMRKQT